MDGKVKPLGAAGQEITCRKEPVKFEEVMGAIKDLMPVFATQPGDPAYVQLIRMWNVLAIILPGILEPVMIAWPRANETKKILNPYNPDGREALESLERQDEILRVRERYDRAVRQVEALAIHEQTPSIEARRAEFQAEVDKAAAELERLGSPVKTAAVVKKGKKTDIAPEAPADDDLIHDDPATAGEGPR